MGPNGLIRRSGTSRYRIGPNGPWTSATLSDRYVFARNRSAFVRGDWKAPNPWSYTIDEYVEPRGSARETIVATGALVAEELDFLGYAVSVYCPAIGSSVWLPNWAPSWMDNAALDRLNEKVRGSLDVSVALGELGSTVRMIRSCVTFDGLVSRLDGIVRRSRKQRNRFATLKRPSDLWLEYTYGWKPLISDIYNAADESVRFCLNRVQHISAKFVSPLSGGIARSSNAEWDIPFQRSGVQGVKYGVRLDVPQSRFDLPRWTSLNPLSIAWELTPYSFVVDWFLDVGSMLRNCETALLYGSRFRDGYRSRFLFTDIGVSHARDGFKNSAKLQRLVYSYRTSRRYRRFERIVLPTYPFPHPPSFKVELGWQRLTSSAALLAQFLKS